ncbi:sialidase family protein [Flavobacterium adhaerens]|uniref:sialidase family protein n=1 Tax=Flavobacterium adhaerens TaxID=3149043 RepID=UPI0032B5AED2
MMKNFKSIILFLLVLPNSNLLAQQKDMPFSVNSLFDFKQPETLGLEFAQGAETFTLFSPKETENKYNHGVVLFAFKGVLYAQWQSSSVDEDADDTQVFFSRSTDGKIWEKPKSLTTIEPQIIKTSGGWWSHNDTLIAFINVWKTQSNTPKGGQTMFITTTDGQHWEAPKPVKNIYNEPIQGIIEQDLRNLSNGRIITAFHMQPGLIATPFYTDNTSGISGWKAGEMKNLPSKDSAISRELEPSWFYQKNGEIVMLFRDQNSTFKKLASVSRDNGKTWTTPTIIDTPDSRAKQSAGNLPNGTAFMVNNPSGNKNRYPLVITLSKDGYVFDKAYIIRSGKEKDLQPMQYEGKYKRIGYSYPKSFVVGDYLYIGYATNKEDIEITRIPLKNLYY